MSRVAENLGAMIGEVIANRTNLAAQIAQNKERIALGEAQLERFDALIAALQVSAGDAAVQKLVEEQAAANAALTEGASSPTDAASEASSPDAATLPEAANSDDAGPPVDQAG